MPSIPIFKKNFPDSSVGKESACNAGDPGSIPGLGRYPGGGKSYPIQYSCLESSLDNTIFKKDLRHFIKVQSINTVKYKYQVVKRG